MFLASTRPVSIRRSAYVPALHSLDRLLDQALSAPGVASATCQAQARTDESGWTLSLDVPGVSKEQLTIGIEGQVVRIESLEDAPRQYRRIQRPARLHVEGIVGVGLLLPGLQAHGGGHGDHGAVVGAQVQLGVVHAHRRFSAGGVELAAQLRLAPTPPATTTALQARFV
jgi:hypothetical protein